MLAMFKASLFSRSGTPVLTIAPFRAATPMRGSQFSGTRGVCLGAVAGDLHYLMGTGSCWTPSPPGQAPSAAWSFVRPSARPSSRTACGAPTGGRCPVFSATALQDPELQLVAPPRLHSLPWAVLFVFVRACRLDRFPLSRRGFWVFGLSSRG